MAHGDFGFIGDPEQSRRLMQWLWLVQDVENTIADAKQHMRAGEFDWRGLGLREPGDWQQIRRAMIRWHIDQQVIEGENHVRDRHHSARRNAPARAPAQVAHASPDFVFKAGPLPSVTPKSREARRSIPGVGV